MDGTFFFKGDMLPTKGEVFKFIHSRIKFGKNSQNEVIAEAAQKVNEIWTNADTCPLTKKNIIIHIEKLLKDRKTFLKKNGKSQPEKNKLHPSPSDSTRKRRLPSTGRQPSKRVSNLYQTLKKVTNLLANIAPHDF